MLVGIKTSCIEQKISEKKVETMFLLSLSRKETDITDIEYK